MDEVAQQCRLAKLVGAVRNTACRNPGRLQGCATARHTTGEPDSTGTLKFRLLAARGVRTRYYCQSTFAHQGHAHDALWRFRLEVGSLGIDGEPAYIAQLVFI